MRELIDKAPLAQLATELGVQEKAAQGLYDDRVAAVVADVRRRLEAAIADAERPPERGLTAAEEAAHEGISVWAVWKRRQRAARKARAA